MPLPKTTIAEYAQSAQAEGARVFCRGDVWWREVRPFFFRPLLPYLEQQPNGQIPSLRAALGGFQHVVPTGAHSNSAMSCLMFRDAQSYSLGKLNSDRRRQVNLAAKRFSVRPFVGCTEFQHKAHAVYVSFQQRTRYTYLSDRLKQNRFARWAESLFRSPGTLVLGAFAGSDLVATSVSRVIGDTLLFSTFFARRDAMQQHVSSLVLHRVRAAAAESGDIKVVFAGMRKTGKAQSVDEFYLHRGCTIQPLPARLTVNPITRLVMRTFRPALLRTLIGERTP
jgi:hypothetical protein